MLIAALLLFGTLGGFVWHGGAYIDDWWLSGHALYSHAVGFSGAWQYFQFYSGGRPGAGALWYGMFVGAGEHLAVLRFTSLLLGCMCATVFYALLSQLRMPRVLAGSIALVFLLFPGNDSIRFWITPSVSQVGISLYLLGMILTLRAFSEDAGWRRRGLHLLGASSYVASLSVAETTLFPIAASLFLYLVVTTRRSAIKRWLCDMGIVLLAIRWFSVMLPQRRNTTVTTLGELVDRVYSIASESLTLVTSSLAPWFHGSRFLVVGVLVIAGIWTTKRYKLDRRARISGRRVALVLIGFGAIWLAAAYLIYVPAVSASGSEHRPLGMGIENRTNIVPALGYAVLIVGSWVLLATVAGRGQFTGRAGTAAFMVGIVATLGSFTSQLRQDEHVWEAAAQRQQTTFAAIRKASDNPKPGTVMLVFGSPRFVASDQVFGSIRQKLVIPVLTSRWDLMPAAWVTVFRSPNAIVLYVHANFPSRLACLDHRGFFLGEDNVQTSLDYSRLYFLAPDLPAKRIKNRKECLTESRRFPVVPEVEEV